MDTTMTTTNPPAEQPVGQRDLHATDLLKGAAAGAIAGAAGAFAMELAMRVMERAPTDPVKEKANEMSQGMSQTREAFVEKLEGPLPVELSERQVKKGETLVHYATGAIGGALYGMAAEVDERATLGHGAAFGVAFWAASSETALPLLGLSPPPWERKLTDEAIGLGMHVMYGLVAETVREPVRRAMD